MCGKLAVCTRFEGARLCAVWGNVGRYFNQAGVPGKGFPHGYCISPHDAAKISH